MTLGPKLRSIAFHSACPCLGSGNAPSRMGEPPQPDPDALEGALPYSPIKSDD